MSEGVVFLLEGVGVFSKGFYYTGSLFVLFKELVINSEKASAEYSTEDEDKKETDFQGGNPKPSIRHLY